jgi:pseudaminic acid biosynthesis-associated methylase
LTEQSEFWAGEFGEEYIDRNSSSELLASNLAFFSRVLECMGGKPSSVFEIGTNIGMNLDALRLLAPRVQTFGIEVNHVASEVARKKGHRVTTLSIEDFLPEERFDLVITKGVLIHLNPSSLLGAYEKLATASARHVLIAEYFSPKPSMIEYRGQADRLFKRDFAGEFLEIYSAFQLRASGFLSARGVFPQDDINWYLLERSKSTPL